jgi:hypothetical protein
VFVRQSEHEVPRETFVALRARRDAYRIANEVLYGKCEEPPVLPLAPLPLAYGTDRRRPIPPWVRTGSMFLLAMMAFFAIAWFGMAVGMGTLRLPGR